MCVFVLHDGRYMYTCLHKHLHTCMHARTRLIWEGEPGATLAARKPQPSPHTGSTPYSIKNTGAHVAMLSFNTCTGDSSGSLCMCSKHWYPLSQLFSTRSPWYHLLSFPVHALWSLSICPSAGAMNQKIDHHSTPFPRSLVLILAFKTRYKSNQIRWTEACYIPSANSRRHISSPDSPGGRVT